MTPVSERSTIETPPVRRGSVVERANILAREARQEALETFRQMLLVSESTVQADRMILNIDKALLHKVGQSDDVEKDQLILSGYQKKLREALIADDATAVLDTEAEVEKLTLQVDPMYLEREDDRRKLRLLRLEERNAGWMSSPSSKFIQLMKGDTKGEVVVTREERRSCMAKAAWTFALTGMVIAIAFLVADFYTAQRYPVLRTDILREARINLPTTTFCMAFPNVPSFHDRASGILGDALFAVTGFENRETDERLGAREALGLRFDALAIGPSDCDSRMQAFRAMNMNLGGTNISERNGAKTDELAPCYSCFQTRRASPITLHNRHVRDLDGPPVLVEFARSKTLDYCFRGRFHARDTAVRNALVGAMRIHADELESRGILGAETTNVDFGLEQLTARVSSSIRSDVRSQIVEETAEFLCNVYFFSGFFFPVERGIDIRYIFVDDNGTRPRRRRWVRRGEGPYHEVEYLGQDIDLADFRMEAELGGMRFDAFHSATRVYVYAQDASDESPPSVDNKATSLADRRTATLRFVRVLDVGHTDYRSISSEGGRVLQYESTTLARYSLEIGLATFQTYVSTRRPATSLAEFLSDVFEYVGLFTGVCAYSVLVAPARMYLRRHNHQSQSQASHAIP